MTNELTQIHGMGMYTPMDPDKMTADQERQAMRSLMLITEKRDGRTKARGVADGSSQRRRLGYKKEDSVSPTVSTNEVFITGAIEAWEERIIASFDIPGLFYMQITRRETLSCYLVGSQLSLWYLLNQNYIVSTLGTKMEKLSFMSI